MCPDLILQEDVTNGTVLNIVEEKVNPCINDDSVEKSSISIYNSFSQNNKNEPVYVNSDVDNTYLKVSVSKVHFSENGIRLSIKVLWNILKDERQTEDWIGYYIIGLNLYLILFKFKNCSFYTDFGYIRYSVLKCLLLHRRY